MFIIVFQQELKVFMILSTEELEALAFPLVVQQELTAFTPISIQEE